MNEITIELTQDQFISARKVSGLKAGIEFVEYLYRNGYTITKDWESSTNNFESKIVLSFVSEEQKIRFIMEFL